MNDCPVCRSQRHTSFFETPSVPVHIGLQWPTAAEARACPRGDISLTRCEACGFIWNETFDPARTAYSGHYENSLHFSPLFRTYATELAHHLVDRYALRGRDIVEVGCGDGEFLRLLCEAGGNRGTGFDPSLGAAFSDGNIRLVPRAYGENDSDVPADLVCCRQVLEHIEHPVEFLRSIRRTLGSRRAVLFFEVPDFVCARARRSGWDIIYEHCSYFGPASLDRTFREAGFEILDLRRWYGDIFIGIEASTHENSGAAPASAGGAVTDRAPSSEGRSLSAFASWWPEEIAQWQRRLAEMAARGRTAVLWGAGARAVSFLNVVHGAETIHHVVDLNPRKHGLYLAGGGQAIVPPASLIELRPDVVILTNGLYRDEVAGALAEMRLEPEILIA